MARALEARETADLVFFHERDNALDNEGMFDAIMRHYMPPNRKNAVHLNLFPGAGVFGLNAQSQWEIHVLDMHPNRATAENIALNCADTHTRFHQTIQSTFEYPGDSMIRRKHSLENKELKNADFDHLPSAYWVIHDNLRSASVLREILGSRQVDSASILFPAAMTVAMSEAPFPALPLGHKAPKEELIARRSRAVEGQRSDSFALVTKIVRSGGRLIVVNLFQDCVLAT